MLVQLEAMFQADVGASKTIGLAAWRRRGLGEWVWELRSKPAERLL